MSIDWVGSPDVGAHNISQRRAVVAVTYAEGGASSTVDGCAEQRGAVHTPVAPPTRSFHIGARGDPASYGERDRLQATFSRASSLTPMGCVASGRYFQGILHELLVYDRPLAPTELASATAALRDQYHISTMDCELPRPVPTLDCTALRSSCVKGTWPRGEHDRLQTTLLAGQRSHTDRAVLQAAA